MKEGQPKSVQKENSRSRVKKHVKGAVIGTSAALTLILGAGCGDGKGIQLPTASPEGTNIPHYQNSEIKTAIVTNDGRVVPIQTANAVLKDYLDQQQTPSPIPEPTPISHPSPTPNNSPTPKPVETSTPAPTKEPTPTRTPSPTPTRTPTSTPSPTPTPTPTETPLPTPTPDTEPPHFNTHHLDKDKYYTVKGPAMLVGDLKPIDKDPKSGQIQIILKGQELTFYAVNSGNLLDDMKPEELEDIASLIIQQMKENGCENGEGCEKVFKLNVDDLVISIH